MKSKLPKSNSHSDSYDSCTKLVHSGDEPKNQHGYVNSPVYRGSTIIYDSVATMEATFADTLKTDLQSYGRFGTPASRAFEKALADIEGGDAAMVAVSGLAAITTAIWAFVQSGDHLLVTDSIYFPTRSFCDSLKRFGIETEYYDPCIGAGIETLIRPNTKLVFLESPGSMTFEIQDVPAITKICKKRNIKTLIDNTWATPLFYKPLTLGVDVSIHSATKYIIGHSDSLLGVIICKNKDYEIIRTAGIRLGQCAGPDDVFLAMRGLKTLSVRLQQHQGQALELAQWLQSRPEVELVIHPALKSDPGYTIWKRDFSGSSGLFAIVLKPSYSKAAVDRMLNGMKLLRLGHSWGGFESLMVPMNPAAYRKFGWKQQGPLLRIHAGLEDLSDLKADLDSGFQRLNKK